MVCGLDSIDSDLLFQLLLPIVLTQRSDSPRPLTVWRSSFPEMYTLQIPWHQKWFLKWVLMLDRHTLVDLEHRALTWDLAAHNKASAVHPPPWASDTACGVGARLYKGNHSLFISWEKHMGAQPDVRVENGDRKKTKDHSRPSVLCYGAL